MLYCEICKEHILKMTPEGKVNQIIIGNFDIDIRI